jgi:hypothetical protein
MDNRIKMVEKALDESNTQKTIIYTTALEFYDWLQLRTESKDLQDFGPYKRFAALFEGE